MAHYGIDRIILILTISKKKVCDHEMFVQDKKKGIHDRIMEIFSLPVLKMPTKHFFNNYLNFQ